MRKWKKTGFEEEEFDGDYIEDEFDRYAPIRRRKMSTMYDSDGDDDEDEDGPSFDDLEDDIRSGKYKPKPSDPWNAHLLFQFLKDTGKI